MSKKNNLEYSPKSTLKQFEGILDDFNKSISKQLLSVQFDTTFYQEISEISNNLVNQLSILTEPVREITRIMSDSYEGVKTLMRSNLLHGISEETLIHIHKKWLPANMPEIPVQMQLETSLKLINSKILAQMEMIKQNLAGQELLFPPTELIANDRLKRLNDNINNAVNRYNDLMKDIVIQPEIILKESPSVYELSNRYFFSNINLIPIVKKAIYPDKQQIGWEPCGFNESETTHHTINMLNTISKFAGDMLLAAHQSLKSNNRDKTRHVFISLRELTKYIVNALVSDKDTMASLNKKPQITKTTPSFKDKLNYVAQSYPNSSSGKLSKATILSNIDLLEVLNEIHNQDLNYSDVNLFCVIKNVELFLCEIITFSRRYNVST